MNEFETKILEIIAYLNYNNKWASKRSIEMNVELKSYDLNTISQSIKDTKLALSNLIHMGLVSTTETYGVTFDQDRMQYHITSPQDIIRIRLKNYASK
jgi:hypothetical protein